MNPDTDQIRVAPAGRNPFWVCLAVFLVLAVDNCFRLDELSGQRQQLEAQRRQLEGLRLNQTLEAAQFGQALSQQPQIEFRLQVFSMDLLQVAKTNAAAQEIVREFKIQWTPAATNRPAGKQGG
jgi:hypothetical protein